jgi:ribosomal protein S18 acetylase RimI-like enzyme
VSNCGRQGLKRILGKLTDIAEDTRYASETGGWQNATRVFVKEIWALFFHTRELLVLTHSLEDPFDILEPRIPISLGQGAPQDIDKLGNMAPPSYRTHYQRLFTHEGSACSIATYRERIVACCWSRTRAAPDIRHPLVRLESDQAYIHSIYTTPAFRRLGIQSALISYHNAWLRNQGYKHIITIVATSNTASLKMMRKLGYKETGRLKHRRILFWELKTVVK